MTSNQPNPRFLINTINRFTNPAPPAFPAPSKSDHEMFLLLTPGLILHLLPPMLQIFDYPAFLFKPSHLPHLTPERGYGYHSLLNIVNCSLTLDCNPNYFKQASIQPLLKKRSQKSTLVTFFSCPKFFKRCCKVNSCLYYTTTPFLISSSLGSTNNTSLYLSKVREICWCPALGHPTTLTLVHILLGCRQGDFERGYG